MKPAFSPFRLNWITIAALFLLCLAGTLRFSALGNLPGVNADEADMGVQLLRMLHGQAYSLRTHTGQFFDPVFILSESALLKIRPQNFYLLRLPAAFLSALGILLLMHAFVRAYQGWTGAFLLGALSACFPVQMMFSRLGWDPTFLFFWTPVLLYCSLRLLDAPRRRDRWILAIASVLSIWTHMTAAIFVLALLAALWWMRRDFVAIAIRKRLPIACAGIFPQGGGAIFFLCALVGAIMAWVCWFALHRGVPQIADLAPSVALRVLIFPGMLSMHLRLLGDLCTGYRTFTYFVGAPPSLIFTVAGWIGELALVVGWVKLSRRENLFDRFLAVLLLFYFALILLTAGFLHLYFVGNLRYLIPLMVLLPLVIVRAFPHPLFLLIICAGMLGEYWVCFAQPALNWSYPSTTEPTFWTGAIEPKAKAAELILALAKQSPPGCKPRVYTDMYWLAQPLEFVLFDAVEVRQVGPTWDPAAMQPGDFLATYAGDGLTHQVANKLSVEGKNYQIDPVYNQNKLPQIAILQVIK